DVWRGVGRRRHHVVPSLVDLDEYVGDHPDPGESQSDPEDHDRVGPHPEVLVDEVVYELSEPDTTEGERQRPEEAKRLVHQDHSHHLEEVPPGVLPPVELRTPGTLCVVDGDVLDRVAVAQESHSDRGHTRESPGKQIEKL